MQLLRTLTLLAILITFMTACSSSGPSEETPSLKIGDIFTDIIHYHESFNDKWGVTPNSTIKFSVSVNVSDPKGVANLSQLYFYNKVTERQWFMLGGPSELTHKSCYINNLDIFECIYYSSVSLDRVNLTDWEIVAENTQGKTTRKSFEFLLPSGDAVIDEQFVYSDTYSGSTLGGVAALEAMTISDNKLTFSSNPDTQSFHIEFENLDSRATNYALAFYDGTIDINYIAQAHVNSPSIVSMPIIQNQTTSLDLPWSEIELYNGASINDINGLHITLYDTPIESSTYSIWFNYLSFSEFITLPL